MEGEGESTPASPPPPRPLRTGKSKPKRMEKFGTDKNFSKKGPKYLREIGTITGYYLSLVLPEVWFHRIQTVGLT